MKKRVMMMVMVMVMLLMMAMPAMAVTTGGGIKFGGGIEMGGGITYGDPDDGWTVGMFDLSGIFSKLKGNKTVQTVSKSLKGIASVQQAKTTVDGIDDIFSKLVNMLGHYIIPLMALLVGIKFFAHGVAHKKRGNVAFSLLCFLGVVSVNLAPFIR
jgi:hypothetical protein